MKDVGRYGKVLPLYIHEPEMIQQPDVSRQHQAFIHETLAELDEEIKSIGGELLQLVGGAVECLSRLDKLVPITRICTHRETTQAVQFQRDVAVRQWCRSHDVEMMEFEQNGVARGSQKRLSFPEYFSASAKATLKDPRGKDLSSRFEPPPMANDDLSTIPMAEGSDKPGRQRGGRSQAETLLRSFFNARNLNRYPYQLSSPNTAFDGCSRLSVYLAYGIISDRSVFQAVDQVITDASQRLPAGDFEKLQDRARFYLDRLMWRRQYIQTFEDNPKLETECPLSQFNGVREAEFNADYFEAWKQGRTGVPYIDAGIRCLHHCGYANMRLRATLVSFASVNLWLPVTEVAEYLATQFLDYDPSVHFSIHHIVAGTSDFDGLMVYDPMKQALDHDVDGAFIRSYLPELKDLSGAEIHNLAVTANHLSPIAEREGYTPYPAPIVDCRASAKIAKQRIHDLKKGVSSDPSPQIGLF